MGRMHHGSIVPQTQQWKHWNLKGALWRKLTFMWPLWVVVFCPTALETLHDSVHTGFPTHEPSTSTASNRRHLSITSTNISDGRHCSLEVKEVKKTFHPQWERSPASAGFLWLHCHSEVFFMRSLMWICCFVVPFDLLWTSFGSLYLLFSWAALWSSLT